MPAVSFLRISHLGEENENVADVRVGIQLASLRLPFKAAIETAARLGAEAVEVDARGEITPQALSQTGLRQIRKLLEDYNLRVCAVGFRTRRGYNDPDRLVERIEATKAAMDFAYRLGANVVINHVGRVPEEAGGADWNLLIDVLGQLGRHAEKAGAFLAAETGSESGPQLARLIAALPEGALRVNFDPGNLAVNNFSVTEAVEVLGPQIIHVHAKDGVRDFAQGRGVEVPLGRGSVDFPNLLGSLAERGYQGYYTVERENAADPINEVAYAVQYLKNM